MDPASFVVNEEEKDQLIDEIEGELKECTEELGLPYIRPTIERASVSLIYSSLNLFIRKYILELQHVNESGVSFVYL